MSAEAEDSIHLGWRGACRFALCASQKMLMAGAGSSRCIYLCA